MNVILDAPCCTQHPAQFVRDARSYTFFHSVRVLEKGILHDRKHLSFLNSSIPQA